MNVLSSCAHYCPRAESDTISMLHIKCVLLTITRVSKFYRDGRSTCKSRSILGKSISMIIHRYVYTIDFTGSPTNMGPLLFVSYCPMKWLALKWPHLQ